MHTITRRAFLRRSGQAGIGLGAAIGLSACSAGDEKTAEGKSTMVQWWSTSQPDIELNKKLVADQKAELGGASVDVRYIGIDQYAQSLQLAKQSGQLPDLVSAGNLGMPLAQLIASGWLQPMDLSEEAQESLKTVPLFEGIHKFDGKLYTFPIHGAFYTAIPWFHTDPLTQVGLDPKSPPATYDEFRAVCTKIKRKFGSRPAGVLLALKGAGRNGSQADQLAQAAGFDGMDGQLFKTGEFAFHTDPYINAIEFQKALFDDGLATGGVTLDVKQGQARWAGGESVFYWDGPYIPGNVNRDYPKLKGRYGVGTMLVPDASRKVTCYVEPAVGNYWIPQGAKNPEVANKIASLLASADYLARQVEVTGDPPPAPWVMESVDAEAVILQDIKNIQESCFLAPVPAIKNAPGVSAVYTQLKPVQPDLGTLIQGYFSGDVSNLRAALKKLSDESAKALETAIKAATAKGAKVSMDDFVFPNWKSQANYTQDMYV